MSKSLDNILNTAAKVKIVRYFTFQRDDFMASGREIARAIKMSAPAAHAALKGLYTEEILQRDIKGKLHLYRLNVENRLVKTILKPAFLKEKTFMEDAIAFLIDKIKKYRLEAELSSVILYGSQHAEKATEESDVDIAVVVREAEGLSNIENIFIEKIVPEFDGYFKAHLDIYIKTKKDFIERLTKNLPPVKSLIKSYSVIYGENPIDWI